MFNLLKVSVVSVFILMLFGCSSTPSQKSQSIKIAKKVDLSQTHQVKNLILSQYALWKGTPYEYGGTDLNGVDCSAFVQNTYRTKLGYNIPRTTRTQIKLGSNVSKQKLQVGDIVFFKTGRNSLHNGIYIGDSKFIHASTSKGVTISSLENRYWQQTYYTSKRIR
ncbi:bifunctional murein DD-endopeptidase/murein LD-carboxypeptidase [Thiomicrorhabdus immobilis]|uniref:Bifunctional murein DD-endopeptidase/murein LD-carboxypeptidase n=1 Tax=Thiomicrorhabdus immobilis TaxID=2791037 RepID=A0ABN6CWR1_9GAMM|nr:NlpC/P60 family protein [Thiomicrorhabdus immobilis]BCN93119.1 bifunctional murein DD-endopeptidase/murein LD-carboxypeptidase [Thiomicrorhabdus immobilis]